ncbi:MAG: sporulation protein [Saprospiraceae bacterium]|nr:sporulation protein [Saprospiraceae bacterium]
MLNRVKKWLGIEGVKVELLLPEEIKHQEGSIKGTVRLSSMNAQTVTSFRFKLVEKYIRGRRKSKLTDEYLLAEMDVPMLIDVPANQPVAYAFELPFEIIRSRMDELEGKNFLLRGLVKAAKSIKAVKSEYRLEVEADVIGTALNPFDNKIINII